MFGGFPRNVSGHYGWCLLLPPVLALLGFGYPEPQMSPPLKSKPGLRWILPPAPIDLLMSPAGRDGGRPASPSQAEPLDPVCFTISGAQTALINSPVRPVVCFAPCLCSGVSCWWTTGSSLPLLLLCSLMSLLVSPASKTDSPQGSLPP